MSQAFERRTEKCSSIPPLKKEDGTWVTTREKKSELFRETFTAKYKLHEGCTNKFSDVPPPGGNTMSTFHPIRARRATHFLKALDEDSGTGPDLLASRILKRCHSSLGVPVAKLARKIVGTGKWPTPWKDHWVPPLHKKKAVYEPKNYRGLHLTAQLSKVLERLISEAVMTFLEATDSYGPNQFAYRKKKGDAKMLWL